MAIQLIRKSDATPMLELLEEIGSPVGSILSRARLPGSFAEGGAGFVPFRYMLHFADVAARQEGIPDLCWRAVQKARPDQLGGWGVAVARCPTLRRAILTFCDRFHRDAPLMSLGLRVGERTAWVRRRRPSEWIGVPGEEQGQEFALASMVRIVRSAAGPDWVPRHVLLESASAPWKDAIADLEAVRIDLRQPLVAVAFPVELLDCEANWPIDELPGECELEVAADSLAGSLKQALVSLLPAISPSLEEASELADLSPRTLRRRLAEEGTSWRSVLDEARLGVALTMLADPDRPISVIASDLGYADQAGFTRAFRRWTAEAPTVYRQRLTRAS